MGEPCHLLDPCFGHGLYRDTFDNGCGNAGPHRGEDFPIGLTLLRKAGQLQLHPPNLAFVHDIRGDDLECDRQSQSSRQADRFTR
jgi:hypothetical protein